MQGTQAFESFSKKTQCILQYEQYNYSKWFTFLPVQVSKCIKWNEITLNGYVNNIGAYYGIYTTIHFVNIYSKETTGTHKIENKIYVFFFFFK